MSRDINADLLEEVLEVLEDHSGPDSAITSGEIADLVGINDSSGNPKTREAIRILQEEQDIPVAASANGYFLMTEPSHLSTYLEKLDSRIAGIEKRKESAAKSWNRYKARRDEDGSVELTYGVEDDEAESAEAES